MTRPLLSRGIDDGDDVVLIRPDVPEDDLDSRAREAITDVERLLQEIEPNVSVTTERISPEEFANAVLECSDLILAAEGELIVTLGGGARDVLIPFVTAVLAHARSIDTSLFFSDIDGTVDEWNLPCLTATLHETTEPTVVALERAGGEASIPILTDATGQSKSTVTRHVKQLEEEGIIDVWTEGKTKHMKITLVGELLFRSKN